MSSTSYTFGVEFEFCVLVPIPIPGTDTPSTGKFSFPPTIDGKVVDEEFLDFEDAYDFLYQDIAETLTNAGFPAKAIGDHVDYSTWTVFNDASIKGPDDLPEDMYSLGVELVSPVLPYTAEGCAEVMKVLELVKKRYHVNVNDSTNLHFHTGMRSLQPGSDTLYATDLWGLKQLKKLNAFLYTFSELLNTLHPAEQIFVEPGEEEGFFGSIRRLHYGQKVVPSAREAVAKILRAKTHQELLGLSRIEHDSAYDLSNAIRCAQDKSTKKSTVEFRQHAGTMDGEVALPWLHVVMAIVKWSRETPMKDVLKLINKGLAEDEKECVGKDAYSVLDLMGEIGVENEVVEYYRARGLYEHERFGTIDWVFSSSDESGSHSESESEDENEDDDDDTDVELAEEPSAKKVKL